ncbi:MAG TPA: hypothetical protein VIH52_04625 [Candidatus Nanoarchaeia archaeon]
MVTFRWLNPIDFLAALINLVVLGVSVVLLLTHQNLPSLVPLWFSKVWGQERLSEPVNLWLIPGLILAFFVISNVFGKALGANYPVLAKIFVWSSAFISIVFLLALYKIILIVI